MKTNEEEVTVYDTYDTTSYIDTNNAKTLADIGLKLPKEAPTTVISIRLPNRMLNAIRSYSSEHDLPYQSVIKFFLQEEIVRHKLEPK
jgi:predicted DNA binding CopG/RHH family protein